MEDELLMEKMMFKKRAFGFTLAENATRVALPKRTFGFTLAENATRVALPKRTFGFTLAETLITLGILGVVASLTMPSLIANHQKQVYTTQLHKVYNIFSQATEKYMADQNVKTFNETDLARNGTGLKEFVRNYFEYGQECEKFAPCFAQTYTTITGNASLDVGNTACPAAFMLADGTAICLEGAKVCPTADCPYFVKVKLDINGPKPPNKLGRDAFYFEVQFNNSGIKISEYSEGNLGTVDTSSATWHNGAFGKIEYSGWKMDY